MASILLPLMGADQVGIQSHGWESGIGTLPAMGQKAQHQLRDNLRQLFDDGVTTYSDVIESGAVTNGTLARIVDEAGQNVQLSQLDLLAEALGCEPWQLLCPDFELASLSVPALKIARKMDSLKEESRETVYSVFVQAVDFANVAKPADASSAPGTAKPKLLQKVRR